MCQRHAHLGEYLRHPGNELIQSWNYISIAGSCCKKLFQTERSWPAFAAAPSAKFGLDFRRARHWVPHQAVARVTVSVLIIWNTNSGEQGFANHLIKPLDWAEMLVNLSKVLDHVWPHSCLEIMATFRGVSMQKVPNLQWIVPPLCKGVFCDHKHMNYP